MTLCLHAVIFHHNYKKRKNWCSYCIIGSRFFQSPRQFSQPVEEYETDIFKSSGLREDETGQDVRVCNSCWTKAQRKKHCPMPSCTSTKGRVKGSRLRHMPAKWADLNRETKELVARDLRKCQTAHNSKHPGFFLHHLGTRKRRVPPRPWVFSLSLEFFPRVLVFSPWVLEIFLSTFL